MTPDETYARNVENVARAAVYLLFRAEEDGDFVKIPIEDWKNYKAVIEASIFHKNDDS